MDAGRRTYECSKSGDQRVIGRQAIFMRLQRTRRCGVNRILGPSEFATLAGTFFHPVVSMVNSKYKIVSAPKGNLTRCHVGVNWKDV
jgi:hypothetical protein